MVRVLHEHAVSAAGLGQPREARSLHGLAAATGDGLVDEPRSGEIDVAPPVRVGISQIHESTLSRGAATSIVTTTNDVRRIQSRISEGSRGTPPESSFAVMLLLTRDVTNHLVDAGSTYAESAVALLPPE